MARTPRGLSYREDLVNAMRELLPPQWFSQFDVHGNTTWTPQRLTWVAVLMGWDKTAPLSERFEAAVDLVRELCPRWKLGASYSGFSGALLRETPVLAERLGQWLRRRMRPWLEAYRVHGWRVFAVDGSRFEAPRTVANERRLGCAGRAKTTPQIFQTTLWHVGSGLPWEVRLGPGTDSERRHLEDMLCGLPPQSLLSADAGFISYDLCRWLIEHDQGFLLRVGGNFHLLTELFGCDSEVHKDRVYLWPTARRDQPPLVLRSIVLENGDKEPVYLVTNLFDPQQLSHEAAAEIYQLRWGVEVYYRSFKKTLGHSRLLSTSPEGALVEQTWRVLAVWLLQFQTAAALIAAGRSPRSASTAKSRTATRRVLRRAATSRHVARGQSWKEQLGRAVLDSYQRHGPKQTRDWPRKKRDRPPGPPNIRPANAKERQQAQHFEHAIPLRL